jgi:hypothetical protein
MNSFLKIAIASAFAAALLPAAAASQDVSAQPTYGTLTLTAGFTPDPATRRVEAGGPDRVERGGCTVYLLAAAPDLDINYTAGRLSLTIAARSQADVVLLVNTPDGKWHCDDDSGGGTDAQLVFTNPQSGNYNIWVGTYNPTGDSFPHADVYISEVGRTGASRPSPSPPAAQPTPAASVQIRVCVLAQGTLQEVNAQYNRATGDTIVNGRPFREVFPTGPSYAAGAEWYINNEPITLARRRYVKYGLPRVLGVNEVAAVGEYRGVRVFAEAGVQNPPELLYVPVRVGCEFQPYQLELR